MQSMFILQIFRSIERYLKIDFNSIEYSENGIRLHHNTTYIYITSNKLDSVGRTFTIQLNEFKVNDVKQMLTPSTNKSIRG